MTRDAPTVQFLKRRGHRVACLTVDGMAGFVDHRLEQADRALVEVHLLTCAECMDAVCLVLEARQEIDAPARDDVSHESRERLYRLLRSSDEGDRAKTFASTAIRPTRRSLANWSFRAAAVLAVCLLGYQVGEASHLTAGEVDQVDTVDPTFGLFDDSAFWIEGELLTAAISNAEVYQQ